MLRRANLNFYHFFSHICRPGWLWLWVLGLVPQVPADPRGLRSCRGAASTTLVGNVQTEPGSGISLGSLRCLKSNPLRCCRLVRGQLRGVGAALGLSPSAPRCAGFCYHSPDFVPATKGLMAQTAGTQQSPDCHENGQSPAAARGIMKLWPWVGEQELKEGLPPSWGHTALPTLLAPNSGFSSKFLGLAAPSDGTGKECPGRAVLAWPGTVQSIFMARDATLSPYF